MNTLDSTTERQQRQFDAAMFEAYLAYLGHPPTYRHIFTRSEDNPYPYPCDPCEASELEQTVWVQVNTPKPGLPRKKAENEDIVQVLNITLDTEYPPDPERLRVVVIEFVRQLIEKGYIEQEAEPPIEDSGAGNHIVIPITPLKVAELGGSEVVNGAVSTLVNQHFVHIFNDLLLEYGLDNKGIKLEGFDISRILSAPGTWRPGNTKPGETAKTRDGYLRRWVYPYVDGNYPQRRESKTLADMVKAKAAEIRGQREAVDAVAEAEGIVKAATQPSTTTPNEAPTHLNSRRVITAAPKLDDPAAWLIANSESYKSGDRSAYFHKLLTACRQRFGDDSVIAHAQLINQLTGNKYDTDVRLMREVQRSLEKVRQLPRLSLPEYYDTLAYHYDDTPTPFNSTILAPTEGVDPYADEPEKEGYKSQPQATEERSAQKQHHFTDLGNARRLVERFGQDLRFVKEWGWLCWDGRRWQLDKDGAIERFAKKTIRSIYAEAGQIDDPDKRKATVDHAKRSEARSKIDSMVEVAKSEPEVTARPDDFDADPWLLNCKNGLVDLRTGQLLPHDRPKLITKLAPVDYEPEATCPTFLAFLNKIMAGKQAIIDFLQRAIGYTLTGLTTEQVMFLLWGTGRNGKTTLLEVLADVLGDYAQQSNADTFLERKSEGIRNDIARLAGARFVSASEPDASKPLSEAVIKQLTGGDRVTARFLNKEYFEFRPTSKIFMAANHKPQIKGQDIGIWRRIMLVPFEVTIPVDEVDKHLPDKLRAELPGILAWAVRGCLAWQSSKSLNPPQEVLAAIEGYKGESDTLSDFMSERVVRGPGKQEHLKDVYKAYAVWCEENGERPMGKQKFIQALTERGLVIRAGTGNYQTVFGLELQPYAPRLTSTTWTGPTSYAARNN